MLQPAFIDRKLKILVVGDDANSRTVLRKELQTAHCDTITAENGKEGVSLAATVKPDLILFDVRMPLFDSFTICQQLRSNPVTCAIPIIFLTETHEAQEIMTGIGFEAVDHVVKPYTLKELKARIQKVVILRDEREKQRHETQQSRDRFVMMLSVELRRPIHVIAGLAELLEQKLTRLEPMVQVAYLREIIRRADDLNDRINDFQCLVNCNPVIEEVDVVQVVRSVVEKFGKATREKGQRVILRLPKQTGLFIQGNNRYLFTALKHLISSAHKFTDPGGIITVTAVLKDDRIRVEVTDTGADTSPSQKLWILERDHQAQPFPSGLNKDTGLELMIVKSVAEQHRGKIGIESRTGQGRRIWLDLPIHDHDYSFSASDTRF